MNGRALGGILTPLLLLVAAGAAGAQAPSPVFAEDRPHYRLRVGVAALELGLPRHLQYAPHAADAGGYRPAVDAPQGREREAAQRALGEGAGPAVRPGIAGEKAVAAATVVYFPTPATQLSELDREALENIVRLAVREGCEVLVWTRAKNPDLMSEATRRSNEIKTLIVKAAPLLEKQIATRITTRPGGQGVEVVISALRAQQGPSPAAPPAGDRP